MTRDQLDTAKNGIIRFMAGALLIIGISLSGWSLATSASTLARVKTLEAVNSRDHENFEKHDDKAVQAIEKIGEEVKGMHSTLIEVAVKVGVDRNE